jgi:glutathione S-transferase
MKQSLRLPSTTPVALHSLLRQAAAMRVHAIPASTNVERVALALGLKGLGVDEWIVHRPGDRTALRAATGQELVPVLETDDGRLLSDSMVIVDWIDRTWPQPALYPADPGPRREVEGFITFFDDVWKVAPNAMDAEQQADRAPDEAKIAAWAAQLRGWQHGFEALLHDRPYLFGHAPGAADICAYPFLKFATSSDPDDDDLFHGVLVEHLGATADGHPNLAAWIDRMSEIPAA